MTTRRMSILIHLIAGTLLIHHMATTDGTQILPAVFGGLSVAIAVWIWLGWKDTTP